MRTLIDLANLANLRRVAAGRGKRGESVLKQMGCLFTNPNICTGSAVGSGRGGRGVLVPDIKDCQLHCLPLQLRATDGLSQLPGAIWISTKAQV